MSSPSSTTTTPIPAFASSAFLAQAQAQGMRSPVLPSPKISTWIPSPVFKGSNGFAFDAQARDGLSMQEKMENRWFAQFTLRERGVNIELDDMETELRYLDKDERLVNTPTDVNLTEPIQRVSDRIKIIKARHLQELEALYDIQANEYEEEQRHRYFSRDGIQSADPEALDSLYSRADAHCKPLSWGNDYAKLRYIQLQELLPLEKERSGLQKRAEDISRRREQRFPLSVDEYNNIRHKSYKLRIAKFLKLGLGANAGGKEAQDKIINEYGWSWRQVMPLKSEFDRNEEFKKAVLEFQSEETSIDPRKKR